MLLVHCNKCGRATVCIHPSQYLDFCCKFSMIMSFIKAVLCCGEWVCGMGVGNGCGEWVWGMGVGNGCGE